MKLVGYGQYRDDFFNKLELPLISGKRLLDVGCGDGSDAEIFIKAFGLETYGVDIYQHARIARIAKFHFQRASATQLPFADCFFDYVFMHDVLHHVDEVSQAREQHLAVLRESQRICRPGGLIIIVEANRHNPLFYPHMVWWQGHAHFSLSYFKQLVLEVFPQAIFEYFEAHMYPAHYLKWWKLYEYCIERFGPTTLLAYNAAIIVTV